MRTIGYLLGIPEQNQEAIRDTLDDAITLKDGDSAESRRTYSRTAYQLFADYIDWRAEHPSDDLMTQLLNAEIEDDGELRRLTRTEVLMYTSMVAGAGNETTTRSDRLRRSTPRRASGSAARIGGRLLVDPGAIEEVLRYEAPSPVQARYVAHDVECRGRRFPRVRSCCCSTGRPTATSGTFPMPSASTSIAAARISLRAGSALLPGLGAGAHAGAGGARGSAEALAGLGSRLRQRRQGAHRQRARLGEAAVTLG